MYPERTRGSERALPLMRLQDGSALKREVVQHYLRLAAMSQGYDGDKMGSHSLRIGGATAMYHTTNDLQRVRRFGRWASDCFHGYLWESHEQTKGLASKMATDATHLMAP